MNVLDLVLLALFIPAIIRGLVKGFLEQALAVLGVIASIWLAYNYSNLLAAKFKACMAFPDIVLNVTAFILVMVAALFLILALAKLLSKAVEMASLGWLNKSLGVIFGIVITAVTIGLLIVLFDGFNTKFDLVHSDILTTSELYGPFKDLGNLVFPYLKGLFTLHF